MRQCPQRPMPTGLATLFGLMLTMALASTARADTDVALTLSGRTPIKDAWPLVSVLPELGRPLVAAEAQTRLSEFSPPQSPYANLGVQHGAVWLSFAVQTDDTAAADWILYVDYPSLDLIAVTLLDGSEPLLTAEIGRNARQPYQTRSHHLTMHLEPGQRYRLLLRVTTASSMILCFFIISSFLFYSV